MLASAGLAKIGMVTSRVETIRRLSAAVAQGGWIHVDSLPEELLETNNGGTEAEPAAQPAPAPGDEDPLDLDRPTASAPFELLQFRDGAHSALGITVRLPRMPYIDETLVADPPRQHHHAGGGRVEPVHAPCMSDPFPAPRPPATPRTAAA